MVQGNFPKAVEELESKFKDPKKNVEDMPLLLELASAYQFNGQCQESVDTFLKASERIEENDYLSVSAQTASILLGEENVQYRAPPYEVLFVPAALSLCLSALGDTENARTQARKIDQLITRFRAMDNRLGLNNPLAHTLAAVLWETDKQYDNAYVEYNKALGILRSSRFLNESLLRAAHFGKKTSAMKQFSPEQRTKDKLKRLDQEKQQAQVIVFSLRGFAPKRIPDPQAPEIPRLVTISHNLVPESLRWLDPQSQAENFVEFERIYSVEQEAIETYQAELGALVAKRIAAKVAKALIAEKVSQENELAGLALHVGMMVADRADLRQWALLPKEVHVARVVLPPGPNELELPGGERVSLNLKPRETKILYRRRFL